MDILNFFTLKSNKQIKINFDGGDLSSDAGLLLTKEFAAKIGFTKLIKKIFKTNDKSVRIHKGDKNLMQMIYQIISAYFEDDCADELILNPVFNVILEKDNLASQPTLSRFSTAWMRIHSYSLMTLKQNSSFVALASDKDEDLYKATREDQISYAVTYGEFMYRDDSWDYPRRVAIVRTLIKQPKIVIADEPTGALDEDNTKKAINILKKMNQRGITLIITTHDKNISDICDRTLFLKDGVLEEKEEI